MKNKKKKAASWVESLADEILVNLLIEQVKKQPVDEECVRKFMEQKHSLPPEYEAMAKKRLTRRQIAKIVKKATRPQENDSLALCFGCGKIFQSKRRHTCPL